MTLNDVVGLVQDPRARGSFTKSTTSLVLLLLICTMLLLSSPTRAEEVRVEMRTATETASPTTYTEPFVSTFRTESPVVSRLRRYQRDVRGRWVMPEVRSRPSASGSESSAHIPLSLKTPDGEILIELNVLIDGQPTHEVLTQLLQRAVTEASKPGASNPETSSSKDASQDITTQVTTTESENATGDESDEEPNVNPEAETPIPAGVTPTRYQRDTAIAKLVRFLSRNDDEEVDDDELEWMLDQWRPGPIWLIDRASVHPPQLPLESLAVYLDQDRNASFSFQEIDALTSRFDRIDLDRDRIITQVELDTAANQIQQNKHLPAPRFDWSLAWKKDNSNSTTPATSLRAKFIVTADLNATGGQLSLACTDSDKITRSTHHASITLTDAASPTTLTISGYFDSTLSENARVQTSIAATVSRNPIWRMIDVNGDLRLGEPERLAAADRLKMLDSDGDQVVSPAEIPKDIAIVICQGNAAVDKTDSSIAFPPLQPSENRDVPPWFRSMDTNQDNAISRKEFLGGRDAFKRHVCRNYRCGQFI